MYFYWNGMLILTILVDCRHIVYLIKHDFELCIFFVLYRESKVKGGYMYLRYSLKYIYFATKLRTLTWVYEKLDLDVVVKIGKQLNYDVFYISTYLPPTKSPFYNDTDWVECSVLKNSVLQIMWLINFCNLRRFERSNSFRRWFLSWWQ